LGRGENREEKRGRRLSAIARSSDDAQRASSNPAAASFVPERRTPATATYDLTGGTTAVSYRSSADDEQNSRPVLECVVHRDQAVGINDDFFRQLLGVQR